MSRQGNKRHRTVNNVKSFWNKEADEWGDDPRVTIRDHYFRLLEIDTILPFIKGRSHAIDIGCGTGFSSLFYAEVVNHLVACDYAKNMIDIAKKFLNDKKYLNQIMTEYSDKRRFKSKNNIIFEVGNILDLKYQESSFDGAVVERVLINLPKQEQQYTAIKEVARILKPNGRLVLVEVTQQGHTSIDKIRNNFGLNNIEKYWHNLYIDEKKFEKIIREYGFTIVQKQYFEVYQFLSKVVYPLLTSPEEPVFMSGFNKAAKKVALVFPTYSTVQSIGLEKFMVDHFRPLLVKHESLLTAKFDLFLPTILNKKPNFKGCSHQVLYVLDKKP